ncbi:MAG: hypothetical protein WA268_19995 [Xanthobacteraceae bacterium]
MLALVRATAAFARAGYKRAGEADEAKPGSDLLYLLHKLRRDDLLVVVSVTHLAPDTAELRKLLDRLTKNGVKLHILRSSGTSADDPLKRYENDFRRAGMQRAKAAGTHIGRPRTVDRTAVRRLSADGLSVRAIAKQLGGVSKSSVQRCLGEVAG